MTDGQLGAQPIRLVLGKFVATSPDDAAVDAGG